MRSQPKRRSLLQVQVADASGGLQEDRRLSQMHWIGGQRIF
jgi:hypothetical protein